MKCRPPMIGVARAYRAVTLLEVVLAMSVLVVVSSMTFWFYSSSLETSREGTDAAGRLRLSRVLLDRMATEIRQAASVTIDNRVGIRGEAERIWLSSYRVPRDVRSIERLLRDEPVAGQYDLTKVEYKIAKHEEILHEDGYELPLGLARVEILIPRPDAKAALQVVEGDEQQPLGVGEDLSGDLVDESSLDETLFPEDEELEEDAEAGGLGPQIDWEELYAPEIRYLRFCYYDGHSWWDDWEITGENPLPQLVEVTIGYDIRPPFGEASMVTESEEDEEIEEDPNNPRRLSPGEINEEFCTCRNQDPVECVPLAADQLSMVVRIPQADPLFRSRVSRETQSFVEELSGKEEEDGAEEEQ